LTQGETLFVLEQGRTQGVFWG